MVIQLLGKQIAQLRKAAGMTQAELAEKSGYSVEFISMVERGINAPSIEGCERLANSIGVPIKDLFDFRPDKKKR